MIISVQSLHFDSSIINIFNCTLKSSTMKARNESSKDSVATSSVDKKETGRQVKIVSFYLFNQKKFTTFLKLKLPLNIIPLIRTLIFYSG